MPRDALIALAGRAWMGAALRSGAAIAFPSIALLEDRQPVLGILLYLVEIILTALMLVARTSLATLLGARAGRGSSDEHEWRTLRKAHDLAMTTVAVALLGLPFLLIAVLLAHPDMDWPSLRDAVLDRGRWLALLILASAVLDTFLAPVRAPDWLRASVSMQMTRTILLHPVILFGFLLFGLTGSLSGMVVIFVAGRIVLDGSAMLHGVPEWARRPWSSRTGRLE